MCRKLAILVSLALVLGLAGGASAAIWTDADADNDWCNGNNWNPVGEPNFATEVFITNPNDVEVTCDANAASVEWNLGDVGDSGTFTINAGKSLEVEGTFQWNDGLSDTNNGTATMHIYGELVCKEDNWNSSFRGPERSSGEVHIYDGARLWTGGRFRGADKQTGNVDFYIHGGDVNVAGFMLGDNGSGNFYMTGGTMICRADTDDSFSIRGRFGADLFVLIDGGADLYVEGWLRTPEDVAASARVNINDGSISCGKWAAAGEDWVVDINDNGILRIRGGSGQDKATVQGWIDDDKIIGKGGAVTPIITEDADDLVLTIAFVNKTAYNPYPSDEAINVCPDANLIWSTGVYVDDHNIYFGTSMSDVNESAVPKQIHYGPNEADPGLLAVNTTYYWRIDTVNDACAPYKWEGGIWSFTTHDGNAFAVSPEDGETGVTIDSNLVWNACEYDSFNVYFSLEFNDVNARNPAAELATGYLDTTIDPCAGDLTPARDYYWAVDVIRGFVTWPGDVWTFRSKPDIIDPAMRIWYKLDETSSDDAFDSSGYENHGNVLGGDHWDPNDGKYPGCIVFNNNTRIGLESQAASTIQSAISVSVWLKDSHRPNSNNWVFGWGDDDELSWAGAAVVGSDGTNVFWRAGNDTNDVLEWDMQKDGVNPATLDDWHYWVFVKDEVAGFMKIYFDAEVMESNDVVDQTLSAGIRWRPGRIGAVPWHGADLIAKLDDFRLYDKALNDSEVEALFRGGNVGKAWKPDPPSGASDVDRNVEVSWRSGNFATHHDVYFGKNRASVRDANLANQLSVYQQRQVVSDTNDEPGLLELGETYYWRIDEVNEPNNPDDIWKGDVWSFAVAPYVTIDDFEQYDTVTNKIFNTWEDGNINLTGSFLDLGTEPFSPAHGGFQSMLYVYDNTIKWDWDHYWSEAALPFDPAMDWTDADVKVFTLYFYGDPTNDANDTEELYVGVTGSLAEVRYTDDAGQDNNDLKLAEWTEWNVAISDFIGVDPCAVTMLLIGFGDRDNTSVIGGEGIVYFDDIRLHPPRCVPAERKPAADLNNDCIVSWGDIEEIGVQWLRTDACMPTTLPSPGPVAHWEFEEGDGNSVSDSANSHDGVAEGAYAWVEGKIGTWAMEFSGGRVLVPDHNQLRPETAVSATAWVFVSWSQDQSNRVVVKGADNAETYALQVSGSDRASFIIRDSDPCGPTNYSVSTDDDIYFNEWTHLAGVCSGDTNTVSIYVNGQLGESANDANFMEKGLTLSQDTNDLAIGDRSDATNRSFEGVVDDTRIYDRALTDAEVAWLATEGSGYWPLELPANFYDEEPTGQKAINIRDAAVLLNSWLEEKLWPE